MMQGPAITAGDCDLARQRCGSGVSNFPDPLNEDREEIVDQEILDGLRDSGLKVDHLYQLIDFGSMSFRAEAGDSIFCSRIVHSKGQIVRRGWLSPAPLLDYEKYKKEVIPFCRRKKNQNWSDLAFDELLSVKEPLRSALHSFFVNIFSYEQGVPLDRQNVLLDDILYRSLIEGPSFAEEIDELKAYQLIDMQGRVYADDEIERTYHNSPCPGNPEQVGDLYRSNHLFGWIPKRPDIFEYVNEPVDYRVEVLEDFRTELRLYLNEPDKILFNPDNEFTRCQSDVANMVKEGPQWKQRMCVPAKKRGVSKIVYINRELKQARVACVEEYSSLTTVKFIESNVSRLLKLDKRCVTRYTPKVLLQLMLNNIRSSVKATKRGESFIGTSWCRDFKKEGLTKPRILMRIMMEELSRRYPDSLAFSYVDFFDDWRIEIDGKEYQTERGHGLGMGNSLTTLMQIVIERLIRSSTAIEPKWSGYSNDDAACIFRTEEEADVWKTHDQLICFHLGLKFKKKASFSCRGGVTLCEQHVSLDKMSLCLKDCFSSDTIFGAMKCVNAAHSREYMKSVSLDRQFEPAVMTVCKYWGPVLFPSEFGCIHALGGWFRNTQKGVDCSFSQKVGEFYMSKEQAAAIDAYDNVYLKFRPWIKESKRPSKRSTIFKKEYCELKDIPLHVGESDVFRRALNPRENFRAWSAYQNALRTRFKKAKRSDLKIMSNLESYLKEAKKRIKEDIIPPRDCYKITEAFEVSVTDDVQYKFPYAAQDPYIEKFFYERDKTNIYPIRMNARENMHVGFVGGKAGGPSGRQIFCRGKENTVEARALWNRYLVPCRDDHWHRPIDVLQVAGSFLLTEYRMIEPLDCAIIKEKEELLSARELYYGRKISPKEWLLIGSLKTCDQLVLVNFRQAWINDEKIFLDLIDLLRKYPGYGDFFPYNRFDKDFSSELMINTMDSFYEWCNTHRKLRDPKVRTSLLKVVESAIAQQGEAENRYILEKERILALRTNQKRYFLLDPVKAQLEDDLLRQDDGESETHYNVFDASLNDLLGWTPDRDNPVEEVGTNVEKLFICDNDCEIVSEDQSSVNELEGNGDPDMDLLVLSGISTGKLDKERVEKESLCLINDLFIVNIDEGFDDECLA